MTPRRWLPFWTAMTAVAALLALLLATDAYPALAAWFTALPDAIARLF